MKTKPSQKDYFDDIAKFLGRKDLSDVYTEAFNNAVDAMVSFEKKLISDAEKSFERGDITKQQFRSFLTELRWQVTSACAAYAAKDLGILASAIVGEILIKYESFVNKDMESMFNKILGTNPDKGQSQDEELKPITQPPKKNYIN